MSDASARPTSAECIFCSIVAGDAPSWKVYEDDDAFGFLDVNPWTEYHTLVVPKAHVADVFAASEESLAHVVHAVKQIVTCFEEKLGLRNVQLFSSSGTEAQQEVMHLHVHVVPRAAGDGQDISRATHPSWRPRFDELLARLD